MYAIRSYYEPSTVSGGGKSEISKSMQNAIKYGSFYIENLEDVENKVDEIINKDYSNRWKKILPNSGKSRSFLSKERALVITSYSIHYTKLYDKSWP